MEAAIRRYESLSDGIGMVCIGDLEILVPDHPFWKKFARGWEPDTERIYRNLVKPGSVVLDVGAWIGPTLVFALLAGVSRIIALEPNPDSYLRLKRIIELNPKIADRVTTINCALHSTSGKLKMGVVEGELDTSTFGILGNNVEVDTISLDKLMQEYQLDDIDFIKIDIEGAEVLLPDELERLSRRPGRLVHLSVHVPFFPETADKQRFAKSLSGFTIYDDRGEKLTAKSLRNRLLSSESHPAWGTQHGNFFELLLIAKQKKVSG
ncbi:MAG: FkbM family methyltransferase [Gammaproteobacteria bacterium]|nr:FkbM family methyltransferase [Gammaproteobacteria bacterium]